MIAAMVPLGEISQQIRGVTYSKADVRAEVIDDYEMLLRANNITDDGIVLEDVVYVPSAKVSRKQMLLEHDVVIAASSGSLKVVGKSAPFGGGLRVTFGAFCKAIRPDTSKVDPRYFSHAFRTADYRRHVERRAAGANINNLRNEDIDEYQIPLPPLEEQRRIAGILDAADALRRRRREALALLDTLPGAIFAKMFGDSEDIPEVPLHDLCRPKQWKTIKGTELTASGYPVYGANGKIGFYSTYNHENPTVLITCRGATCGTINICEPKSYVTGNAMALDDPDGSRIGLQFLAHALRVRGVNDAITGTAQPQITRQSLTAVSIKVPDKSKQLIFERSLNGIEEQRVLLQDQLQEIEALFASLQSRAFAGEL
ncbi:restriction endonuclease subunit S [Paracoccus jeotgali]|uniref:Type I restriction modification DNA specificity domain-containing protein n=1 Tax=Paracoccus jeotgali TaxID=2065379 RepID=A0A2K9ME69_9RHOB|nr:restriction endonuclease subunit S [Paracoccus jeotgali]AUM73913.1 hypothetical protein CYR75_06095 [Paracoccus jeotgali]